MSRTVDHDAAVRAATAAYDAACATGDRTLMTITDDARQDALRKRDAADRAAYRRRIGYRRRHTGPNEYVVEVYGRPVAVIVHTGTHLDDYPWEYYPADNFAPVFGNDSCSAATLAEATSTVVSRVTGEAFR